TPELKKYHDLFLGEIAEAEDKSAVDVMLDMAVGDNLKAMFFAESFSNSLDLLKEVVAYPYSIYGVSDGGAHTKFLTAGRDPTETIIRFARDNDIISLEEAHWRLSAFPAFCAGFQDRGTLRLGAPADIVVYNLEQLGITDTEVVYDLPGNEWRRIQKAVGYRYIMVNGEVTMMDGKDTGATPGVVLRHGGASTGNG
ncbi:MAG: amidohydrolase family protein, partial [Acidimicrobiales bacterium]|nr:amidohydrolase family protein [Acidimicrobiales bacterium]